MKTKPKKKPVKQPATKKAETDPVSAQLGARIRHARLVHRMTLKEVAVLAQCSESIVSKIERNLAVPSLAMMHRLARAVNTNISELLAEDWPDAGPVFKAGARSVYVFNRNAAHSDIELEVISSSGKSSLLQAYIHVVQPGAKSDGKIEHIGEEVGYVLEGSIVLLLGDDRHELNTGDAFHFSSQTLHGYENSGKTIAKILWVNTPVTF